MSQSYLFFFFNLHVYVLALVPFVSGLFAIAFARFPVMIPRPHVQQ